MITQTDGVADHAAPEDDVDVTRSTTPANVTAAVATLLPAVLWLLGVYVFDGDVPMQLQGAIGLLLTGLCTTVVGLARRLTSQ